MLITLFLLNPVIVISVVIGVYEATRWIIMFFAFYFGELKLRPLKVFLQQQNENVFKEWDMKWTMATDGKYL